MATCDSTPLGDTNGRIRSKLVKPSITGGALPYKGKEDFSALVDEFLSTEGAQHDGENAEQTITMSQKEADAIGRKLMEQRNKVVAAEEKLASQEKTIRKLQETLIKAAAREKTPEYRPETALELSAVRRELENTQRKLESKEEEIDSLLPQAVKERIHGSKCMKSKEAEIDRLRQELDAARKEISFMRPQLQSAQLGLERKDAELEQLLPAVIASRNNRSQDAELEQMRRELDTAHAELARKSLDLQQAERDLESKDAELRQLLAERSASRAQNLQSFRDKDAEIERLRRSAQQSRDTEVERLRREAQQSRDAEVERLLHETAGSRMDQPCTETYRSALVGLDQFSQAKVQMEEYLEMRERRIEARETILARDIMEPRVSTTPYSRGGGAFPTAQRGSLWDQL